MIWLVFSFQWHINFRGLFDAKIILAERQHEYYLIHRLEIGRLIPFSRGISPKVNAKMWLQFELASSDVAVQYFSHYKTRHSLRIQVSWEELLSLKILWLPPVSIFFLIFFLSFTDVKLLWAYDDLVFCICKHDWYYFAPFSILIITLKFLSMHK